MGEWLNMKDEYCADCGGYDFEWMYHCHKHKGVIYCRGCECPYCAEDDINEMDDELTQEQQQ